MIRLRHVDLAYPKGDPALVDVSFEVAKGEFVFLTGHSGAGKSTVLKLLWGERKPTRGEVRVAGFALMDLKRTEVPRLRRRIGIVFQDFRLLEDRTAEENVALALEATGARADLIPARTLKVLTQVGLSSKTRSYPRELSGGEQQRVAMARALANDPALILADEPTGNLDEKATRAVFQLLREINAGGTCVLMATHDPSLIRDTPYRVLELRQGRLVGPEAAA